MPHTVQTLPALDEHRAPGERMVVTDPDDVDRVAQDLATGAVVGQAFANVVKGRPPGQVGSITTAPSRIPDVWDWTKLPPRLSRRAVLGVVDTLYGLGPFGFRGPAAAHVPDHLTYPDAGVCTAQVIAPGYACPSNHFVVSATEAVDADLLCITSANRSRHLTGADDTLARADGLRAEFGHVPGDDRPQLVLERHGSMAADDVRAVLDGLG